MTDDLRFAVLDDAWRLADLHARRINEGFLASLGPVFLGRLYRRVVRSPRAFAMVAEENGRIVAFCAAAENVGRLYREFMVRDGLVAGVVSAPRLVRSLPHVVETLRYPAATGELPDAEILAVVTDADAASKGWGSLVCTRRWPSWSSGAAPRPRSSPALRTKRHCACTSAAASRRCSRSRFTPPYSRKSWYGRRRSVRGRARGRARVHAARPARVVRARGARPARTAEGAARARRVSRRRRRLRGAGRGARTESSALAPAARPGGRARPRRRRADDLAPRAAPDAGLDRGVGGNRGADAGAIRSVGHGRARRRARERREPDRRDGRVGLERRRGVGPGLRAGRRFGRTARARTLRCSGRLPRVQPATGADLSG